MGQDAALDDAPCGLVRTEADGTIIRANRTFCRWIGRPADALAGRVRLQELFTMGGRIFHQTHWLPLLQIQGSVSEVKLDIVHADGHAIPMVLNAIRHAAEDRPVHDVALYVARDRDAYERELVMSRRRLEEAVSEAKRLQAEAKDRAVIAEQMIGIVSHDLRNPLSTIQMGATVLARSGATAQQLKVLERIQRAGDRANRLIGDLLDFTQARLGKGIAIVRVPVRLHELVSDAVDELALAFAPRELLHEAAGEGEASADPHRIVQLLGNLVANAIAYGDTKSPVTVRTSIEPERFLVSVHNRGAAIPEALRERLFLPLERGNEPAGAQRSVGLGLYIVSQIAKAHGGAVTVTSGDAEGTTFTAEFPRS